MAHNLAWYQDAKFGLFIHWGAYSVAGVEASWPIMAPDLSEAMFGTQTRITEEEYTKLPAHFNPVDFDADEWVRIAKDAGMRYIVFTAKHHDGFCMFDAPGTDYKITNTPYGKDICQELAQACARAEMPLGFYYSPPDMHHPGYRDMSEPATRNWTGEPKREQWGDYLDYMESHVRKLLTDYGDVKILWFDGLANHGKYDTERFHKIIHELSPNTLINDRLGDDFDYVTPEQFIPKVGIPARTGKPPAGLDPGGDGFFRLICSLFKIPLLRGWIRKQMQKYSDGTLELTPVHQEPYPSPERFQPWETCMTIGQSWAYNPTETVWKSPDTLIQNLVEVVSRGGNYLLNVGPTARGSFPCEVVERLQSVGRWMAKVHQSIYGSTYTPMQGQGWGRATRVGDKVYLHILNWPVNGKLEIESFPGKVQSIALLTGEKLVHEQHGDRLAVTVPQQAPDQNVTVLEVEIDSLESGWVDYSPAAILTTTPKQYIQSQVMSSAVINSVLNGMIAFFSYRTRSSIPYGEAAIDIPITVAIISFFVAWISIGSARKEYAKGNLSKPTLTRHRLNLPKGSALRALFVTIVCVILFGGLFMDGLLFLLLPGGLSNWAYIILKTLYTGISAAITAALSIQSVINEESRR